MDWHLERCVEAGDTILLRHVNWTLLLATFASTPLPLINVFHNFFHQSQKGFIEQNTNKNGTNPNSLTF